MRCFFVKPPKPDLTTGLKNSFEVERDLFSKNAFRDALARTFIAAGQAPDSKQSFAVYKPHARNHIAAILLPKGRTDAGQGCLATMAGDADAATCEDDDEPVTDDEAEEDE